MTLRAGRFTFTVCRDKLQEGGTLTMEWFIYSNAAQCRPWHTLLSELDKLVNAHSCYPWYKSRSKQKAICCRI